MHAPARSLFAVSLLVAGVAPMGPAAPADWRVDPAWHDGRAEKAVYAATRSIYGVERRYDAIAYTNKQRMDAASTVKDDGGAVEVFKHHWSERVPTERYDYDLSTAAFVDAGSLDGFKLTAATQEDCGASFKQVVRADGGFAWLESVYHPGGGVREGRLPAGVVFEDALPLVLRDFPFDAPERRTLAVVPSQKDPQRVPFEPRAMSVVHRGRERLDLPIGAVDAHRLELVDANGRTRATYWFDADGSAPRLHVLVRYAGPGGVTYALAEHERTAYWAR